MTDQDTPRLKPSQLELDSPGFLKVKELMSRAGDRHSITGDEARLVAEAKAKAREELENIRRLGMHMLLSHVEAMQTPYSEQWVNFAETQGRILDRLEGRRVYDLGCGDYRSKSSMEFRDLLLKRGVSEYYGVDIQGNYNGARRDVINMPFGPVVPNTDGKGAHIKGDMLDVVSHLPDRSTNFVLNGIDDLIVDTNTDYGRALVAHIARCTEPGGYVVGITMFGGVLEKLAQMDGFELESPEGSHFLLLRKLTTSSDSEQSLASKGRTPAERAGL